MAFEAFLPDRFSTPHENRFWNKLVDELESQFNSSADNIFIVGNIFAGGKQLDALVVKNDALIIVDFKDYGGKLTVKENGLWEIDGQTVNSGRKNPFQQLLDNKFALLNSLKHRLPERFEDWLNLGHINALVLFHQAIEYDNNDLVSDISHAASKWFSVCDIQTMSKTLNEITSPETNINSTSRPYIFDALGIPSDREPSLPSLDPPKTAQNSQHEESFADTYFQDANNLSEINALIVGQDPYPNSSNGVPFCKNSHYELFQEDCSGGIVLRSLGLNEGSVRMDYKNPKVLFHSLLVSRGICFINISYQNLSSLSIGEIEEATNQARNVNLGLVKKSKLIIVLGKDKTSHYFSKLYGDFKADVTLIHPSIRAKEENEEEWEKAWLGNNLQLIVNNSRINK
jgi:hypothetical protein